MKNLAFLALFSSFLSVGAMATGTGLSSYPLEPNAKVISAEFTGIVSTGGGMGMQARYSQKLAEKSLLDAGLGVSGGDNSSRIFAGIDSEIIPDYEYQPKVSLKGSVESAKEGFVWHSKLGVAPIFSKAYSMWGYEAFPYLSVPLGISLNSGNNTYSTTISFNAGLTGVLPVELNGNKKLMGTMEAMLGVKNSFTGVFVGASYPIL